jgi:hypothetical protein
MKLSEFNTLCGMYNVYEGTALEYPEIVEALKNRQDEKVKLLMDELF